jgi:phosphatidylglycerol:prolipoprotein diacylglycerol transferase
MEGLELGPFLVRWNGLLIALGIAFGAVLAALEAERRFRDMEIVYYLILPLTLWGWIGARLWHVFTPPLSSVRLGLTTEYYLSHPLDMLAFWTGGYGIPGAILGGTLALWLFARKYQLPFWELGDTLTPGLALALAIGRVGNYFNQELYGLPTSLPWGIFIAPDHRVMGYEQAEIFHPLFAYESIVCLLIAALLWWLARGSVSGLLKSGHLFLLFLASYSLTRFLLEFLRLDVALVNGLNINQAFFVLLFLLTSGILIFRHRAAQVL